MSNEVFAKKSLGQHWLNDQASLEAICASAKLVQHDTVLEIGPGLGALTRLLVDRVHTVIAVELDEQLAAELPKRIPKGNLTVISADILNLDFTTLPPDYKVVANIPYYLTSNLIRVLSESINRPSTAILLVQKEVAERTSAEAGAMSLLSVTAQFYWRISLGQVVEAKLFSPPPKVDSRVLILNRRTQSLFPDVEPKDFFRLVKAGFIQRRKTLLNSLSASIQLSRDQVTAICEEASIDPKRRAQTLSLNEWHNLYLSLHA